MADFQHLFTPIRIGTMTVPNRICETTYSINAGRADGLPDPIFIEHHLQKARGGIGWIGNETWLLNTPLPPGYADEFFPGAAAIRFAPYQLPGFVERVRQFTDRVHELGAVCVMQLTHLQSTMCPSPVQMSLMYDPIPHELEEKEIQFIIDTYWKAAERFAEAGADAVEIHCAHETLPEYFLSPLANKRTDAWGGSMENRCRFIVEAVGRIRANLANRINVGLRLNADEHREGGYDLDDMCRMAAHVTSAAVVDYLSIDVGAPWGMPSYVPPMQYPVAAFADAAAAIRTAVNRGRKQPIPILYAGRVNDVLVAEKLLAEGKADLVGMARASIADPDFAQKARAGRLDEIRKCIACNTCIGKVIHDEVKSPACAVNPVIGHELEWAKVKPAAKRKHVVVIGAGPAGCEAARVAAERGHGVTLLDKNSEIGGQMLISSRAPRRESFLDFARWEAGALKRLGVDVRLSTEATVESVLALGPEAVVVATGAVPRTPDAVPGVDQRNVVQCWDVLRGKVEVGKRVVVLSEDDHMETPSVADYLASRGHEVEILHKWLMIASAVERYTQGIVFHSLFKNGVKISPSTRVRRIEGRRVVAYNAHTGEERSIEDVDTVVLSVRSRAEDSLYRSLKGKTEEVYLVGAAFAPRFLTHATQHGANVGAMI